MRKMCTWLLQIKRRQYKLFCMRKWHTEAILTITMLPCFPCPLYSSSQPAAALCRCNAGYESNGDSQFDNLICTACSAGKYKATNFNEFCQPCLEGTYSSQGASSVRLVQQIHIKTQRS